MPFLKNTEQNLTAERLTVACVLSVTGGFLDIYTYLFRGKVFANAVTGNMVLFALNLADLQRTACGRYLLSIFFYAFGVFSAEYIHQCLTDSKRIYWHQSVLLLEILCLLPITFIPYGSFDFAVNALIAFVCALQTQTFRRVHGLPFASTMCTGNLRSETESAFRWICKKERLEWNKAKHYYMVILCFIGGAAVGAAALRSFGHLAFFFCSSWIADGVFRGHNQTPDGLDPSQLAQTFPLTAIFYLSNAACDREKRKRAY